MSTATKKQRGSTSRDLSPVKRAGVVLRGAGRCVWCCETLEDRAATVDHLVSVCQGGGNGVQNLVSACKSCNSARSYGWAQMAAHLSRLGLDPLTALERALHQAIRLPIDREAAKAACESWYPGRLAYLSRTATARAARRRASGKAPVAAPVLAPTPVRLQLPPPPAGKGQCEMFAF